MLKATSVETHQMSLTAKSDAGSKIESVFTLKHIKASEEPNQLEFPTLDKAIESLLEWYRVFDIEADVDGAISEINGITVSRCWFSIGIALLSLPLTAETTNCLICSTIGRLSGGQ